MNREQLRAWAVAAKPFDEIVWVGAEISVAELRSAVTVAIGGAVEPCHAGAGPAHGPAAYRGAFGWLCRGCWGSVCRILGWVP